SRTARSSAMPHDRRLLREPCPDALDDVEVLARPDVAQLTRLPCNRIDVRRRREPAFELPPLGAQPGDLGAPCTQIGTRREIGAEWVVVEVADGHDCGDRAPAACERSTRRTAGAFAVRRHGPAPFGGPSAVPAS